MAWKCPELPNLKKFYYELFFGTPCRFRQAIDKPHIRKLIVTTGLDFENQKDRVVFWFGWQLYTLRLMFTVQAQIECHSKLFEHIIWIMATSSHIKKVALIQKAHW